MPSTPPNRVKPRAIISTNPPQVNTNFQSHPHQQQQQQQQPNHIDRDHHHRSPRQEKHDDDDDDHNNHSQHRNHLNHNNNHHHQHHHEPPKQPPPPQYYHAKQNGYTVNSQQDNSNVVSNGGVRSIKVCANNKEFDTASDKQNQNTWCITNERLYYDDQSGNIPVIPLFTHTANSVDFHKNNFISSNGAADIHYSKYENPNKHGSRRHDFKGNEQDLLSMGRIQEIRDRMGSESVRINEKALWKCLGAEFLGTALLMFLGIGCGLKLEHEEVKGLSFVGVAICWGLTVATLVQSLGGVSCDINPAVTLACLVTGKIPIVKAVMYILIQCLGALAGVSLLKAVLPDSVEGNWGITQLAPGVTPIQGCIIEIISTFVLVLTAFSVGDENRKDVKGSTPLAIGLCVCAIVCCSGPLTGASLNPARSLAPSIIAGNFDNHWIYWVGPIVGAIFGGALYHNVFRQLRPEEVEALEAETQLRRQEREAKENGTAPPV